MALGYSLLAIRYSLLAISFSLKTVHGLLRFCDCGPFGWEHDPS